MPPERRRIHRRRRTVAGAIILSVVLAVAGLAVAIASPFNDHCGGPGERDCEGGSERAATRIPFGRSQPVGWAGVALRTNPSSAVAVFHNLVPGETRAANLVLSNGGGVPLAISVKSRQDSGQPLARQLQLHVRTVGSGCGAFNGVLLYSGRVSGGGTLNPPESGRTVAAGSSMRICLRVTLPAGAGNQFQAASSKATFTFTGVEVPTPPQPPPPPNPPVPPPSGPTGGGGPQPTPPQPEPQPQPQPQPQPSGGFVLGRITAWNGRIRRDRVRVRVRCITPTACPISVLVANRVRVRVRVRVRARSTPAGRRRAGRVRYRWRVRWRTMGRVRTILAPNQSRMLSIRLNSYSRRLMRRRKRIRIRVTNKTRQLDGIWRLTSTRSGAMKQAPLRSARRKRKKDGLMFLGTSSSGTTSTTGG